MKMFLISSAVAIIIGVGGYFVLSSMGTDSPQSIQVPPSACKRGRPHFECFLLCQIFWQSADNAGDMAGRRSQRLCRSRAA